MFVFIRFCVFVVLTVIVGFVTCAAGEVHSDRFGDSDHCLKWLFSTLLCGLMTILLLIEKGLI